MRKAIKKQKPNRMPLVATHVMIKNGDGQLKKIVDGPNIKCLGLDVDKIIAAHKKYGVCELVIVVK